MVAKFGSGKIDTSFGTCAQPAAADEPVISEVEADATPTIWLAYTSETMGALELTDLINRIVKPRLQTVPGVADVQVGGDRRYAMRVWLDPDRLAGYRLTVQDVEDVSLGGNACFQG